MKLIEIKDTRGRIFNAYEVFTKKGYRILVDEALTKALGIKAAIKAEIDQAEAEGL